MLDNEDNINYYKTNRFLKFLRFLNILEPDRNILSISKIFMWISILIVIAVLVIMPNSLDAVIASVGSLIATSMNYSYRRWMQYMPKNEIGNQWGGKRRFREPDYDDDMGYTPDDSSAHKPNSYSGKVDSPD